MALPLLFPYAFLLSTSVLCGSPTPRNGGSLKGETRQAARLEKLDLRGLKNLIRSRNGRVLFVNVWATWCAPCVEEFPDIVKLSDEMKGRKIDFVGISGDDFDVELSRVLPFIRKEKAKFKFYMAKLEGEDDFINTFDPQWGGGIPATFIYDSKGRLKTFLLGKQTYQRLKSVIEQALADS